MRRINVYGFCILLTALFVLNAAPVRAQQNTVEYQCLGLPQFFSVPPGVTQITAVVTGSGGETDESAVGNAQGGGSGGKGAKITATVNVTPGQLLKIDIGCADGKSGFPLGGNGKYNGGAGSTISVGNTILVVAGGGGGAGASGFFDGTTNGGNGGNAISGGNGGDGRGLINPGRGGAFGAAGTEQGGAGEFARGSGGGGGGGGGYDGTGGGGGAGGTAAGSNGSIAGSGGGGGGRSYINPLFVLNAVAALADTLDNGSISITYNGQTIPNQIYQCTGSLQTYTVPVGVRTLSVIGIGGDGGSRLDVNGFTTEGRVVGGSGIAAGKSASIDVTPGEVLSIGVGCTGSLPTFGSPIDLINPGGTGGFGFISGGKGGDGDKPPLTGGAVGAVGGGGATGIGRDSSPVFVAAGGGGGGGEGSFTGCGPGKGGAADGNSGGDASPCANKGTGGATGGGGDLDGGDGCSYCSSGGGGGAGGGFPSGTGGTAGGIGLAGGGGAGGGRSFAGISTQNFQTVDTASFRRVKGADFGFATIPAQSPTNGILIITPIFNALTPPVVTPKIIPGTPNGANGWYRSSVNVSWQVDSSGSPLTSQTGCASLVLSTDTTGIAYQCSATNAFGTTSGSTVQIKRDATPPTLAANAVKQDGTPYVFGTTTNQAVTVTFACSDATSGVVSCPAARNYSTSGAVIASVTDNAGNLTTTNFGSVVNNNQPPTLTNFADVNVPINTPSQNIPFTIGDDTTAPQSLIVTAVSSNPALVPNNNISLPVAPQQGANRDLFVTPATNKVGTTIITVTVRDAAGAVTSKSFTVSVNCANIQINRTSSPTVPFGAFFSDTLFGSGGVAPYTFRQLSGTLPVGLELNQDGTMISGNPVRLGTYTLSYELTDATGCRVVEPVAVTVICLTNYTVSNGNDNDFGTLRFAATGACPNSVIDFTSAVSEVVINGQINVNSLLIRGPGADKLTVRNDAPGNLNQRIFETSGTAEISGMTVTGGSAPTSFGGGIRQNNGNLTVKDSVINNNFAAYGGGGIFSEAGTLLTVLNSTVSNNVGADNNVQGNSAGGIKSRGEVRIINSTISGNTVEGSNSAGGIYAPRGLISNSTITNNKVNNVFNPVNSASGVYGGSNPDRLTVRSSIIAGNQSNAMFPDVINLFTSSGFNLIGNRGAVTAFNQTGDQTGTSSALLDPLLGSLRINGGTTPTHNFVSMLSLALDRGNSFGLTIDQRGFTRPINNPMIADAAGGDGADIGAVEMRVPTAATVSISGRVLISKRGLTNAAVYLTGQNGEVRTATTTTSGYFHFENVPAGQTYVATVVSKRFRFEPQLISVTDDLTELNFVTQPLK